MLSKPVVSKDQRVGRIKQSDIKVKIHTIISRNNYGQISNFRDSVVWWTIKQAKSNQKSYRCLQVVSIHKFRVYKTMSRSRVNKGLEQDFIKMILTKNQRKSEGNKKWIRIGKSRCVELNKTYCCTGKFNVALSLCRVLGITLYFSKSFLEAAVRGLAVAKAPQLLQQKSNLWFPTSQ